MRRLKTGTRRLDAVVAVKSAGEMLRLTVPCRR